jgi:type III pantothenate kinase
LTVIDFGTATTFNVVNERGEFIGGLIAPGIKIAGDALAAGAARLPRFEYELPKKIVNKNTVSNMQAGVLYGAIGTVEYVCARIKRECAFETMKVVATGGLSDVIASGTTVINTVDKTLTLTGLRLIYEMNRAR